MSRALSTTKTKTIVITVRTNLGRRRNHLGRRLNARRRVTTELASDDPADEEFTCPC